MMSICTIQCPSGETCYADECTMSGMCMHQNEAQEASQSPEPRETVLVIIEPCGYCQTRGYLSEQVDVDHDRRWDCPDCNGEGEHVNCFPNNDEYIAEELGKAGKS